MSKFYASGLRRLADALEAEPIKEDSYPDQPLLVQVNVPAPADVAIVAARFGVPVNVGAQGDHASVGFDGAYLHVYAPKEPTP